MAKGSYYKKYRETNEGEEEERLPVVNISDDVRKEYEDGKLLLIDKPLHWTSFDVVRKIRSSIRIKKVGHAGTLDPLASGLLIVCTGKFTKQINTLMAAEKEYSGSFTLGAITPTYDLESLPEQHMPVDEITLSRIREAAKLFTGRIMQFPPVYSAIKKAGTPLYELARRGEAVDPEARPVTISSFEITEWDEPVAKFKVSCSTGTYIRSLAHDLGKELGCGAYLSELRRTRIGEFKVEDAMTMKEFISSLERSS